MSASHCAPNRENQKLTCYSQETLVKIANAFNKKYNLPPAQRIKTRGKTKEQIWHQISQALSNRCSNEICWSDQDFIKKIQDGKDEIRETFRPKMPVEWKNNMGTWLTTDDIYSVMQQYEKLYRDFFFIGPIPIDCNIKSPLRCELTNFDILKLYRQDGKRRIGIVYNTAPSTSDGEHWVCLFINLDDATNRAEITYYDSNGQKFPPEIATLMKRLATTLDKAGWKVKLDWNKTRHQYDGYNCGMYCINYIINRLKGKTLKQIEAMKIPSEQMQKLKLELYR